VLFDFVPIKKQKTDSFRSRPQNEQNQTSQNSHNNKKKTSQYSHNNKTTTITTKHNNKHHTKTKQSSQQQQTTTTQQQHQPQNHKTTRDGDSAGQDPRHCASIARKGRGSLGDPGQG
jgi:hypothetical protein